MNKVQKKNSAITQALPSPPKAQHYIVFLQSLFIVYSNELSLRVCSWGDQSVWVLIRELAHMVPSTIGSSSFRTEAGISQDQNVLVALRFVQALIYIAIKILHTEGFLFL